MNVKFGKLVNVWLKECKMLKINEWLIKGTKMQSWMYECKMLKINECTCMVELEWMNELLKNVAN